MGVKAASSVAAAAQGTNRRVAGAVFLCGLLLYGCASLPTGERRFVQHVVLVWFADSVTAAQRAEVVRATHDLGAIPGIRELYIGGPVPSDREIVDGSFDLGIVMRFDSVDAMNRYLVDPRHLEFTTRYVRGRVERLVVYDIEGPP